MAKKKLYMVVDTETATLPIVCDIAQTAEEKKKLAIAKPLVYDIGWTICDRKGNVLEKKQYLIAETFSVPAIFNTAYYAEKRPIYIKMLRNGETSIKPWNDVMDEFIKDLKKVNSVGAFNAMFDFKKAIPFTELYIKQLYGSNYYNWEAEQYKLCERILTEKNPKKKNPNFEDEIFRFRGEKYGLFDLWGLAVVYLLNNQRYKDKCIRHGMFTASGTFFKSSAESTYRYLCDKYDFIESHTALDDAVIETFILGKITHEHKIEDGIIFFPFQKLGYTYDYVVGKKKPKKHEIETVLGAIAEYIDCKEDEGKPLTGYRKNLQKTIEKLREAINELERMVGD